MIDICIIGGGVAGMTAALYALRQGQKVMLIEGDSIGGQIAQSPRVENFPTIEQISGSELADKLFEQITKLGVEFTFGKVEKLEKSGDIFKIKTDFDEISARAVIIATGVVHRRLGLANEEKLIGHGISYCALCDGAFYTGKDVVLVGDGNTALQYALLLSTYTKTVHIITLFDKFFGDKALVDALSKHDNIKVTHNAKLVELLGETELAGLVFEQTDGTRFVENPNALFVAIGQIPNNKTFEEFVELNSQGYFIASDDLSTKTEGIFVAGDCRDKKIRQLTTAASDGAIAATSACNYLLKKQ